MRTGLICFLVLKEITKSKLDYNVPVRPKIFLLTSSRRFRWAYLVQKEFSSCFDHESMREVLRNLPITLEDTYANVLSKKIPERYKKKARLMLMWLAYSLRPLTLRELAFIASLPRPEAVLQICTSSFVTVSRETIEELQSGENLVSQGTIGEWQSDEYFVSRERVEEGLGGEEFIRFDHFSVKEYLVSERHMTSSTPTTSWFYVPPLLAHLRIAETCVSNLLDLKLVDLIERDFRNGPMSLDIGEDDIHAIISVLEYSRDWHFHVREADSISAQSAQLKDPNLICEREALRGHIHKLFCDENHLSFTYWAHFVIVSERYMSLPLSPLYYAAYLDLPDSVRRLLEPRSNPREAKGVVSTSKNKTQGLMTPLHIAGIKGNLEIVSLFLDSGMRIAQSDFEHMIASNERNGFTVTTNILKAQPDLSITDDAVRAAASNFRTKDFIKYFLNNGFLSSKARVLLVLNSYWEDYHFEANPRLMKALAKHGESIGCTSQDFFNVVIQCSSFRSIPESFLEFVLERYEPLSLSRDITECIASDTNGGVRMLRCLCRNYRDISFSQDLLAAAAKKKIYGMNLVDIILEYDKSLNISQCVIQSAVSRSSGKAALFVMILHNKSLEITWEFLKSIVYKYEALGKHEALGKCDTLEEGEYQYWKWGKRYHNIAKTVTVLMDHEYCGFKFPSERLPLAEAYTQVEDHLDSHEDCKVAVSEQILQAAARWEPDAIDYLQSHARPNVTFRKYAL